MGLVGFYRKFIPNFAQIATALTDAMRKGQPNKVIWDDSKENALRSLKRALVSSPILKLPNFAAQFILQTDASEYGIGSVLLQGENDLNMPIAYASRKLKAGERNYSVIEKECLSKVWSVQKFSRYLYRQEFVLETDHQPLVYLTKKSVANARLMRWALGVGITAK